MNDGTRDRPGWGVETFDASFLSALPTEELARVRHLGISGTMLHQAASLDFSMFEHLESVQITNTNLSTIRGLDTTSARRVSLADVPVTDISPISGLEEVEELWIRSTERLEIPEDLSALSKLEELGLQAEPLVSLDGIETIPTEFHLIINEVEDVSALANARVEWITMPEEFQESQPEIVEEIKGYGILLSSSYE